MGNRSTGTAAGTLVAPALGWDPQPCVSEHDCEKPGPFGLMAQPSSLVGNL